MAPNDNSSSKSSMWFCGSWVCCGADESISELFSSFSHDKPKQKETTADPINVMDIGTVQECEENKREEKNSENDGIEQELKEHILPEKREKEVPPPKAAMTSEEEEKTESKKDESDPVDEEKGAEMECENEKTDKQPKTSVEKKVTTEKETELKRKAETDIKPEAFSIDAYKEEKRQRLAKEKERQERMEKAREAQKRLLLEKEAAERRKKHAQVQESLAKERASRRRERSVQEAEKKLQSSINAASTTTRRPSKEMKEQQAQWQAQQAAAVAAQRQEWEKNWHAKQHMQEHEKKKLHTPHTGFTTSHHPAAAAFSATPPTSTPPVVPPPVYNTTPSAARPHPTPGYHQASTAPKPTPRAPTPPAQPVFTPRNNKHHPSTRPSVPQMPRAAPQPPKVSAVQKTTEQDAIATLKKNILTNWALQPNNGQSLRPIYALLTSIHTVFPPAFGMAPHDYFTTWKPINYLCHDTKTEKLKKAVRKVRFFLHPDKLPKDLDEQQSFACTLLWDTVSEAWEHHESKPAGKA